MFKLKIMSFHLPKVSPIIFQTTSYNMLKQCLSLQSNMYNLMGTPNEFTGKCLIYFSAEKLYIYYMYISTRDYGI